MVGVVVWKWIKMVFFFSFILCWMVVKRGERMKKDKGILYLELRKIMIKNRFFGMFFRKWLE